VVKVEIHGRPVECCEFRPGVAHENVQAAKLAPDLIKHPLDVLGTRDIGLDQAAFGAQRLNLGQGLLCGLGLCVVVDCDVYAALGKLQRDAPPDPARAPGDQCTFPLEWHANLLPDGVLGQGPPRAERCAQRPAKPVR